MQVNHKKPSQFVTWVLGPSALGGPSTRGTDKYPVQILAKVNEVQEYPNPKDLTPAQKYKPIPMPKYA